MISRKDNLFINPQGIGDLAIPLKYFIYNFITSKKFKNDFIIQYESQKHIIQNFNKSKSEFFFSNIFYKFSIKNLKKILYIKKSLYENIFIDPNINIIKAILIALILNSKKIIYRKFPFYKIFFDQSPKYSKSERKKYYKLLNKLILKNNTELNIIKKKSKNIIYGIAPGTGVLEKHKRWPWQYFVDLINNTKFAPDEVYLFGVEKELLKIISKKLKFKCKIINYKNINKSLDKLLSIQFLITNDNGIANFATIYGVKCFIISGPSIPYALKKFDNVSIISKRLKCSPCYETNRYGCGNPSCLIKLKASDVSKQIKII